MANKHKFSQTGMENISREGTKRGRMTQELIATNLEEATEQPRQTH